VTTLPTPSPEPHDVIAWVDSHLSHLTFEGPGATVASPRFRGGQVAADEALQRFTVKGYAGRRNEVLPRSRRGASSLSPYIRHGLLPLPDVWHHAKRSDAPHKDIEKFHDELLWQEYARHLYARIGSDLHLPLRGIPADRMRNTEPWDREMACMSTVLEELVQDGWLVNQTRMWLASQWNVRHKAPWRDGEQRFFTHLLDGSRAANLTGWQWTIGSGNGKPYGFSRWQVEKRAPGLCDTCTYNMQCPIQQWPDAPDQLPGVRSADQRLRGDANASRTAGPSTVDSDPTKNPEAVWITAESLGLADPAMQAHPELPLIFIFDEPLLRHLKLSSKRLVFLTETLAELAETAGPLEIHLGDPVDILQGRSVATTFAPVPGWRRRAGKIRPVEVHPWPWLRTPHSGSVQSFSAWRNHSR
jgi:deoxyribodipyrimidine photo-lyase